jgi:hypothetical protein
VSTPLVSESVVTCRPTSPRDGRISISHKSLAGMGGKGQSKQMALKPEKSGS